jgi:hypothetical protein
MEREHKPSQPDIRKKPRMYFGKPGQEVYNFVFYPRRERKPIGSYSLRQGGEIPQLIRVRENGQWVTKQARMYWGEPSRPARPRKPIGSYWRKPKAA